MIEFDVLINAMREARKVHVITYFLAYKNETFYIGENKASDIYHSLDLKIIIKGKNTNQINYEHFQ